MASLTGLLFSHSLATGNVGLVNDRHRLGANHRSDGAIRTDGGVPAMFQDRQENRTLPDSADFDETSMSENVYRTRLRREYRALAERERATTNIAVIRNTDPVGDAMSLIERGLGRSGLGLLVHPAGQE